MLDQKSKKRGIRFASAISSVGAGLLMVACAAVGRADEPYPADPPMPSFELPDALRMQDGKPVTTAEQWKSARRSEVLELFRTHIYGRVPKTTYEQSFHVVHEDTKALDGAATLREVDIRITRGEKSLAIRVHLFIPNKSTQPAPAFLLICNRGAENIDPTRQKKSEFWPVEEGIARGYAMAAFLNADVDPDKHDGFQNGIHGLLDEGPRKDDAWGTIAAWAWGASRVLDYLQTVPQIDPNQVAVIGHSRGGKTALWAAAEDERFAMAVSNDSGCGGAALSRRRFEGREQVARIVTAFPHWFCSNFKGFANREDELPVDQHELVSLIAPRAVAVGSASEDRWADPRGEFLSVVHAAPVYGLFGHQALGTKEMPGIGGAVHGDRAHYHLRPGKHNLTLVDWEHYWDFADKMFARKSVSLRADEPAPGFRIQLDTISRGYDGKTCWVHPRAGAIPGEQPAIVLTMQKLLLTGSDVFFALNEMRTDDLGKTWSGPIEHAETLGRREEPAGVVVGVCDFTPKWHAQTGKLLGTGHTVRYRNNRVIENQDRGTSYAVYDPQQRRWSPWATLEMPDAAKFQSAGAGSVQRLDLPDGHILLPIYFKNKEQKTYRTTVLRCSFDGSKLTYQEHGDELTIDIGRGLYEPSLTKFGDRFYLTLRNDSAGYVAVSDDGLHFDAPQKWLWDDGTELGNYNTQQHWVTHRDGLFLVYTRKGADNDHVFRHRAPLFIAQIDPVKLRVIRSTERVLIPERGARLGNFAVTEVNERETWVTVAEWMQTWGPNVVIPSDNKYGADNSVYVARILWEKPNYRSNQR